jgi:2',3'-cyclic-nucleotide 2'-phosphodiesterase / 3'-nucleotidase / 5'-nucleotidase
MIRAGIVSVGVGLFLSSMAAQANVTVQGFVVERVIDGDTLAGRSDDGKVTKIRMQGMDAPELHLMTEEGTFAQLPWGEHGERVLSSLIQIGEKLELRSFGQDKYGRTLGQVVSKGLNLNLELVRRGIAVSYAICPANQCNGASVQEQQVEEFAQACREAQAQGLGIFDPRKPLTEMPFEFRLRIQKRTADKFVGNLKTREYLAPARYSEVPVCDRIFFLSEADAQSLGYKAAQ